MKKTYSQIKDNISNDELTNNTLPAKHNKNKKIEQPDMISTLETIKKEEIRQNFEDFEIKKISRLKKLQNRYKQRQNLRITKKKKLKEEKAEKKYIIEQIISPDEKNIKNFFDRDWWKQKNKLYKEYTEKKKQGENTFQILANGAQPSKEYYILTILSCLIATFGLIQNSGATIIGAMIVAPLMTPILATSLGVIWGDISLIWTSIKSLAKGVLLALLISTIISFVIPMPEYGSEIIARTKPNLFDILIAFSSGLVGAYGYSNKKINSTLVGIAIAVALMPPLCTIGIGIGTLNWGIIKGATALFLINLIAISLAGAIVFWFLGIHPINADTEEIKKRALSQIFLSILLLIAISVPLTLYMIDNYQKIYTKNNCTSYLKENLETVKIVNIETIDEEKNKLSLKITLQGNNQPNKNEIINFKNYLYQNSKNLKTIDISFLQSTSL